MNQLFEFIIKHKVVVLGTFIVISLVSVAMSPFVQVNYNLLDYLPEQAASTRALTVMEEEYEGGVPNARIMIEDVTIPRALALKKDLQAIERIEDVTWLDDITDIETPLEIKDARMVEEYFKDG